jgi:hypothetical protein
MPLPVIVAMKAMKALIKVIAVMVMLDNKRVIEKVLQIENIEH